MTRLLSGLLLVLASLPARATELVDFDRDIRPILSDSCFACHGPDEQQRQADLRLDVANDHLTTLVSPDEPDTSEFLSRITSTNPEYRMPPPTAKKSLSEEQVQLLARWARQGGKYQGHWAWEAPVRPELPRIEKREWARNEIDYFIKARLDTQEMTPAASADKITLIRRVSLDLRGLPPTTKEVDAFLGDTSEDAYEKMIGRMLASKHYGERMAQDWLDLARYGDTNGYHADSDRDMWLYRDYVISAFNNDKPFNQFIIENIAGDLMPSATEETRIASGFNRNVTFNEEGGADPDEFYVAYAIDRANTTGQVFLGITFGCAQCHDHKYDPISQKEYYQFYAFFNSVKDEVGAGGPAGYHNKPLPPLLEVKTTTYLQRVQSAKREHAAAEKRLAEETARYTSPTKEFTAAMANWVSRVKDNKPSPETFQKGLILWLAADDMNGNGIADKDEPSTASETIATWHDKSGRQLHAAATGSPRYVKNAFDGQPAVRLNGKDDFLRTAGGGELLQNDFTMIVTLKHDNLDNHQMMLMWGVEHTGKRRGMWKVGTSNMLGFNGHSADVIGSKPLVTDRPQIAVISKQGKRHLIRLFLDGERVGEGNPKLQPYEFTDKNPITIGANNGGGERTAAQFAEVLVFDRVISDDEQREIVGYLATKYGVQAMHEPIPENILAVAAMPTEQWNDNQAAEITDYFLNKVYLPSHDSIKQLKAQVDDLKQKAINLEKQVPTTMVMVQKEQRDPAYVLMRGDFQNPGEEVRPDVPLMFPRMPTDKPRNRLGLAYWLTDPRHPLVARVIVNRLWKQLFGTGLVKTLGDLGTQGERPSHPQLLDWLAVEFIESGWNVKHLQRLMLMSATYRQPSRHTDQYDEIDPDNRLLSRASRFRLSAEEIRDNALSISGLLTTKIGGPSVKPYQPADYYSDKVGRGWNQSQGEDLYRRGIYTYWRRTTVYPTFQIFDAPSREFCAVNRPRTNTPLQALVLLNDPTFVEAARVFGQDIMQAGGETLAEKLTYAFRKAVSRTPTTEEQQVMERIYQQQLEVYRNDPDAAGKLVMQGESARPEGLDVTEHAAWTALASVVLNLDETITRE